MNTFMKNILTKSIVSVFALAFFLLGASVSHAAAPKVTALPTINVTSTTATLQAYYEKNGSGAIGIGFRYGTDPSLTQNTLAYTTKLPTKTGVVSVNITGLTQGTKYYFKAVIVTSSGNVISNGAPFTTVNAVSASQAPTITTMPNPANITATSVDLSGFFDSNGSPMTNLSFDYGTTPNLGTSVVVSIPGSSGTIMRTLGGLSPNTTYWYRFSGTNGAGTRYGSTYSFTTLGTIFNPSCTISDFRSDDYNVDEDETFTLSWVTSGCTYVTISPIVGSASPVSSGSRNVSVDEDTTFTITAGDQFGAIDTDQLDINVYSNNNDDDDDSNATAYSTGASNITATSATLNGRASGYGDSINSWIEFPCWSGNKYDYRTSSGQVTLSHTANNLLSGTTYCYRVGYRTQNGSVYDGVSTTFTTLGTPTWNSWTNNNNNTYTDMYQNPSVIYKTITTKIGGTTNPTRNVFDSYPLGWGNQSFNGSDSNNGNMLGASSFGTGISFLPDTFIGWLLLVIFIMAIVLIARTLMAPKNVGTHH